jgi:hypothetical protein
MGPRQKAARLFDAMLPVLGVAVEVHHREDEDTVWLLRIEHAVGKSRRQTPAHFPFEDGPSLWVLYRTVDGGVDLYGKVKTQTLPAFLIVVDGFQELSFSFQWKE